MENQENNNPNQGNGQNQGNNNQIQSNGVNSNINNQGPITPQTGNGGQGGQQYNNYTQNLNNQNTKKKSKAPIIIIIVVIVVLLFGCIISGIVFMGIKLFKNVNNVNYEQLQSNSNECLKLQKEINKFLYCFEDVDTDYNTAINKCNI